MNIRLFLSLLLIFWCYLSSEAQIKREKIEYEDDQAKSEKISSEEFLSSMNFDHTFYFNVGLGGHFGLGGSNVYSQNPSQFSVHSLSYGNGVELNGGIGFHLNKNLAFEANVGYQFGGENKFANSDISNGNFIEANFYYSANIFKINPAIVLNLPTQNFTTYLKFGPSIGFSKRKEVQDLLFNGSSNLILTYEDVSGTGVGLTSSVGFKKPILDGGAFVYAELNYSALNQTYTKGSMVEATQDGFDVLNTYDIADREYLYVNTIDKNYIVTNPNVPQLKLNEYFNFNSLGLKVGFILLLH